MPPFTLVVEAAEKPHFKDSRISVRNLTPQDRVRATSSDAGMGKHTPIFAPGISSGPFSTASLGRAGIPELTRVADGLQ